MESHNKHSCLKDLVTNSDLFDIHLSEVSCKNYVKKIPAFYEYELEPKVTIKYEKPKRGKSFYIILSLLLEVGTKKKKAFCIGFTLRSVYLSRVSTKDINDEALAVFSQTSALMNLWPYVRSTIHSLSVQMGWKAIVPPLLKKIPKKDGSTLFYVGETPPELIDES